ncbi:MAG: cyclic nucleotide-binding domain-containing protein [Desulfobacterales bacterium]|jgi:CRP-like cAMP-binding protein
MDPDLSKAIVDFFLGIPIFSCMNAQEVGLVAKHMNVIELKPGETLFQEADRGNFMCFIAHGTLDVIKQPSGADQEIVITTLRKGQSIGEMSVIENLPRSATIKARDNAKLFILSQAAFDLVLAKHSHIGIKLLKGITILLSNNLRKTSSRLADYMLPIS